MSDIIMLDPHAMHDTADDVQRDSSTPQATVRWQPVRAGLMNVWRYADEILEFHDGRLLLRGPNGSGKSMALELLLPFLLDASTQPGRLTSAVKTRGGLFDRFMAGSAEGNKTGFLWAEFSCATDPTVAPFVCGARLTSSASSRRVDLAWFTTSQRIPTDLQLLDERRTPLSRKDLTEAIGEHGTVHRSADDYRNTVRTTLYPSFSPAQYEAMLLTLLALRREKVSQDLTPQKLSEVLTAALPPVEEHELARIAEGFEKLDRRRENLERLEADIGHIDRLAKAQARYARLTFLAVANDVRSAESRRDTVTKRERQARDELDAVENRLTDLSTEADASAIRQSVLTTEIDTLRQRDEFKAGASLQTLRDQRDDLNRLVERAAARHNVLKQRLTDARTQSAQADEQLAAAGTNLTQARADVAAIADHVGATAVFAQLGDDAPGELLEAWSQSRRAQIDQVRRSVRAHGQAVDQRLAAERQLERDRLALDEATVENRTVLEGLDEALDAYQRALSVWASGCEILNLRIDRSVLEAAEDPHAVRRSIDGWAAAALSELDVSAADIGRRLDDVAAEILETETERSALVAGQEAEPEQPAWRTSRDNRGGAPFWRLVDPVLPDDGVLDGVEAALVASGLLDAWISPTGQVELGDDQADVFVVPALDKDSDTNIDDADRHTLAGSLRALLVPVERGPVRADVIDGVLNGIALIERDAHLTPASASGPPMIGRDGSFAIAGMRGRGQLDPARYLGAAARERDRIRRLAGVDARLGELTRQRSTLRAEIDAVEATRVVIAAEVQSAPPGDSVLNERDQAIRSEQKLADAEVRTDHARSELTEREAEVREEQRRLAQIAAQQQLPTDEAELVEYSDTLIAFDRQIAAFSHRHTEQQHALADQRRASQAAELAQADVDATGAEFEAQQDRQRRVETQYQTLEATHGAGFAEISARITAASEEQDMLSRRLREIGTERSDLDRRHGSLTQRVESATADRVAAEAARESAHNEYVAAVVDGLAGDASVTIDHALDTITGVLDSARAASTALEGEPDDAQALARARDRVQEIKITATQQLGGRVEISFEPGEYRWWMLRANKDGTHRPMVDVAAAFHDDLSTARSELLEEERRLFDETLTGGVRVAVAERIRRATALVDRINDELGKVRTATAGVQVRLRWTVDPEQPEAVRTARNLLLRDEPGEGDRQALHDFFRARIDQAQAETEGATTWDDRLRAVLDYRAWHRFEFQIAHQNWEGYQPATPSRLQRLSTGERSMALHLPMLASVAAHYDTDGATIGCPRLVLLDELFAGVDVSNRDQLFGLFVTWDLDAVLTSDHEWCAYASLDGIAMHHLHADHADEPVTSTRYVWDGASRRIEPAA